MNRRFAIIQKTAKSMEEEVKQVDEISTAMASRYINKTKDDDTRKAGRTLALKKKWGGKVGGTEAPKVPTTESEEVTEKKWIQAAIKKPGALHKQLGVPQGEKIPASKLKAAAKAPGKTGQRARLAITLSKLRKGK